MGFHNCIAPEWLMAVEYLKSVNFNPEMPWNRNLGNGRPKSKKKRKAGHYRAAARKAVYWAEERGYLTL